MMTETAYTCATCPLARHLEGDRYICTAVHNHHNQVTRGHWEATADCERAIEEQRIEDAQTDLTFCPTPNSPLPTPPEDVDYVMALEARLEKSEAQVTQQQQFSQVVATACGGIEIDSVETDVYRIWAGIDLLGTMRRTQSYWVAYPVAGKRSQHSTSGKAQQAVIESALLY